MSLLRDKLDELQQVDFSCQVKIQEALCHKAVWHEGFPWLKQEELRAVCEAP